MLCFSLVFFDLYPTTTLLHQSLKSLTHPGNRFPLGNYHHISFIRAIKSGVLTMLIQKICHKGILHLQKIVLQPLSANREPHTPIANLNIHKSSWMSRKETSTKKQRGKTRHWLEQYHFVVSTLALGLKINFDQPIKVMEFQ